MTIVGHVLMGLSIGALCLPRGLRWRHRLLTLASFAVLACLPDLRVPWHRHLFTYSQHHSLLVNLLLLGVPLAMLAARPGWRARIGGWPVALGGFGAGLSHLLLDSFYNHGHGVPIGWPFGRLHLVLPLPWFETIACGWLAGWQTVRILATEVAFYGPLLLACAALRFWIARPRPIGPSAAA